MAVKVYYFYSSEDRAARQQLHVHLSVLRTAQLIEVRDPAELGGAGPEVRAAWIDESAIFLCLLTRNFLSEAEAAFTAQGTQVLASPFALDLQRAIVRYHQGEALLIPIIVGSCSWDESFFGKLVPLPRSQQPIIESDHPDKEWVEVAKGLRSILSSLPELLKKRREQSVSKGLTASPKDGSGKPGGHALLIGVGGPNMAATVNDVQALQTLLTDPQRAAFPAHQVSALTAHEATQSRIFAALDQLAQRVSPEDTVLLYYSGHGWLRQVPGQEPQYFLVPHDFDAARLAQTVIFDSELATRLRAIKSRKLVVFFDCCHAGGVLGQAKSAPPPPNLLMELSAGSGRVVVSSSKMNEQSWIRAGAANSVFTECLLEALSGKAGGHNGYATVLGVLDYLFREVPLRAPQPQHPFVNSIQDLSDNFALCYHGGQSLPLPPMPSSAAPKPQPLTPTEAAPPTHMSQIKLQKREALLAELTPRLQTLQKLRAAAAVEDDIKREQKLQYQINLEEEAIAKLEKQLAALG